jgi:hypothetical protein
MNLPTTLSKWINVHYPKKDGLNRESFIHRACFFRDELLTTITNGDTFPETHDSMKVIADRQSTVKGLAPTPVIQISHPSGLVIILTWYTEWIVSIQSPTPITADFGRYLLSDNDGGKADYYGIPKEFIFGNYSKNNREFSFKCVNDFRLYTIFWLIGQNLDLY